MQEQIKEVFAINVKPEDDASSAHRPEYDDSRKEESMSSAYPDDIGGDLEDVIVQESQEEAYRKKFVDNCEDFLD